MLSYALSPEAPNGLLLVATLAVLLAFWLLAKAVAPVAAVLRSLAAGVLACVVLGAALALLTVAVAGR
ncbi:hypothetical protein ACQP2F_43350 [Actinoplanes sp. CA-030573]|uniref:hypothetical protein n=1 Tax=Actinoplanes sp. CA-030573 TaxID=3239898 RepID=UPI003D923F39